MIGHLCLNRRRRRTALHLVSVALVAIVLGACGGGAAPPVKIETPEPPPTTRLVLTVTASSSLNVNTDGSAAPLVVRIYELADGGRFFGTGFFPLYEDDSSVLGGDLIARDEIRFAPGETRTIEKTLRPTTTTLGVLGAYRSTEQRRWRATAPMLPETVNRFRLELGPRELTLTPEP
jgi:type VI secretion system protein VasD